MKNFALCFALVLGLASLASANDFVTKNDAPLVGLARQNVSAPDSAALSSTDFAKFLVPTLGRQNISLTLFSSSSSGTATLTLVKGTLDANKVFVPFARETTSSISASSAADVSGVTSQYASPEQQFKTSGATHVFVWVNSISAASDVKYSLW